MCRARDSSGILFAAGKKIQADSPVGRSPMRPENGLKSLRIQWFLEILDLRIMMCFAPSDFRQ
jgi:hypothetical protein